MGANQKRGSEPKPKGYESVLIDGAEFLYFPVIHGAYKGLYFHVYGDTSLDDDTIVTLHRLRRAGYAAGCGRSNAEAEAALTDYIRGKKPRED